MNVTIPLSLDLIHRLDAEAERRGLTAERLVSETLDRVLPTTDRVQTRPYDPHDVTSAPPSAPEEREAESEEFLSLADELPGADIPAEVLRREHLYEDLLPGEAQAGTPLRYNPRDLNARRPARVDENLQEMAIFEEETKDIRANIPDEMLRRERLVRGS